jgi:DNA/RNA endonuclease G (NUC1)
MNSVIVSAKNENSFFFLVWIIPQNPEKNTNIPKVTEKCMRRNTSPSLMFILAMNSVIVSAKNENCTGKY